MPSLLLLLLLWFLFLVAAVSSHHVCAQLRETGHACPPFRSPPSEFPFASSPGCGHPAFQIHCSSPFSIISINSSSFHLLALQPQQHSLVLSPSLPNTSIPPTSSSYNTSSCPSLPLGPIDLSGSPFRFFPDPCPFLFSLRACSSSSANFSACSHLSSWQRSLITHPHRLLAACARRPRSSRRGECQPDVAESLARFLTNGLRVVWDSRDEYFSRCSSCHRAASGVCGFNDSVPSKPFLCFPSTENLQQRHPTTATRRLLVLTTSLFALACLAFLLLSLWAASSLRRRRRAHDGVSFSADPMSAFLRQHHLRPPVFTFDQLRAATGGFDPRRKIGDGGFGSVYLAQLEDGRAAAVKRLHRRHPPNATASFCSEVLILSSLAHPSLVRLHGYCCDPRGLLLVYDYVPNGTLADHLHGSSLKRSSLTWGVRVGVALQTACALEYLHHALKPPVVHRDVTSANIFLERDMRVRLGDFGLSRLLSLPDQSNNSVTEYARCTGPQGTPGYLDPEYHRSFRLTEKSDVYSFGVVLLELVTGMKAVDLGRDRRDVSLAELVVGKIQVGALHQVVDPLLVRQKENMPTVEAVSELAFRCLAADKDDRPDARELVAELKRIQNQLNNTSSGS